MSVSGDVPLKYPERIQKYKWIYSDLHFWTPILFYPGQWKRSLPEQDDAKVVAMFHE